MFSYQIQIKKKILINKAKTMVTYITYEKLDNPGKN
jgi:hypothetical protein